MIGEAMILGLGMQNNIKENESRGLTMILKVQNCKIIFNAIR